MNNLSVIIVAGGKGSRMGSEIPKQYLELGDKPILVLTIAQLKNYLPESEFILVVPETDAPMVESLLAQHHLKGITIAHGGSSRAESVCNGLKKAHGDFVAIHDGVRPFVTDEMIRRITKTLATSEAVIPAVSSVDSVRIGDCYTIVPRDEVFLIQTPQCFKRELLINAYQQYFQKPNDYLTDDSSIVEYYVGVTPKIVEGERTNIKITTPMDLAIAEYILNEL